MADAASTTSKTPKRTPAKKATPAAGTTPALTESNTAKAKSRFNAALEEAKAGAAALGDEARARVGGYREQAMTRGDDYAGQAKAKAGELAREGKDRASDALASLGKVVADNAATLDDKFGTRYGDYARSAARSLQEGAAKLDNKSVEQLGSDAREYVRKSPGTAVGLAALAGVLWAFLNGLVSPEDVVLTTSVDALLMVVLGGPGTLIGGAIGAGLVVFIREYLSTLVPWWQYVLGGVYVLTILYLPGGLMGIPERIRQRRALSAPAVREKAVPAS